LRVDTGVIAEFLRRGILTSLTSAVRSKLPPRATARLILRYWRLRDACRRQLSLATRGSIAPTISHGAVLALGMLLLFPALPGWTRATTAVAGRLHAASLAEPMPLTGGGPNAFQLRELAIERADNPPPPPAATPVQPAPPALGVIVAPPPGAKGDGLGAIYAVFNGSPGLSWALRVANCESHYNPLAVNSSSGATGLFQFMPRTWNANFPGWNIWDPMTQARAALVFYNAGRQSAWTCK
jgi:hypothetical protein